MSDAVDMSGFDLLGVETPPKHPLPLQRSVIAVATGALGAVLMPKHPMLAFLGGAAVASNVHAAASGDRTWSDAVRRVGRHIVATAGSLALPKYPAIGYIAGAIAADLLIDGQGGGLIEEWTEYEGVRDTPKQENIVDAEIVSDNSKALVKKES